MWNRRLFVILVLLAGCTRSTNQLKDALPVEVQRAWTLKQTTNLDPGQAPEVVRSLGLKRSLEARYEGNGSILVRVYEMNVETSAFELIQKWRQSDGLAVYKGAYFLVATSAGPDSATTGAFLNALKETIK